MTRAEGGLRIRHYQSADRAEWLRMRQALWPDIADAEGDADAWLARPDAVVLVAERPDGRGLAGFAELASRPYADGCETSPVGYLEGWYVDPDLRRTGVGAALVRAGEAWAREQGFRELASDALLDNTVSHRAHLHLGFAEVERAIRYRKALDVADHDIVAHREFPVRREVLYAAFVHPHTLEKWWGPRGAVNRFETFDLRPGGEWRFVMRMPDGAEYPMHHGFLAVEPPGRIAFRHHQAGHGFMLELTFRELDAASARLEWRMRFDSAEEAARVREFVARANEENLDRLAEVLEEAGHAV